MLMLHHLWRATTVLCGQVPYSASEKHAGDRGAMTNRRGSVSPVPCPWTSGAMALQRRAMLEERKMDAICVSESSTCIGVKGLVSEIFLPLKHGVWYFDLACLAWEVEVFLNMQFHLQHSEASSMSGPHKVSLETLSWVWVRATYPSLLGICECEDWR